MFQLNFVFTEISKKKYTKINQKTPDGCLLLIISMKCQFNGNFFCLHRVDDWYKFIKSYLLLLLKWTRFLSIFRPLLVSNNYFYIKMMMINTFFLVTNFFLVQYVYILSFCILMFGYMIHHTHIHIHNMLQCSSFSFFVTVDSFWWMFHRFVTIEQTNEQRIKPES